MIEVPVSIGELVDKLTILEIKAKRIADESKLKNVGRELEALRSVRARAGIDSGAVDEATQRLKRVNEALWSIEDEIRAEERRGEFGPRFVELARSVYRENDKRAALKRTIDQLTGSTLSEEKSYEAY